MAVLGVNLRGLGEARQLLVRGLRGDDAGRGLIEVLQPHGKAIRIERMEFHEARPGLVEENIIAKMPDLGEDHLRIVDRAVIGALLDHGDAERPLAGARLPCPAPADWCGFSRGSRLRPGPRDRSADEPEGVAVRLEGRSASPRPGTRRRGGRPCGCCWSKSTRSPSATRAESTILFEAEVPLRTK